jgi:lipoprotein-anchoring transpeptidase ErfK/SrfK
MRTRLLSCVVVAGIGLSAAACNSGGGSQSAAKHSDSPAATAPAPAATGVSVARANADTVSVLDAPRPGARVRELGGTSDFGFRRAFLVVRQEGKFLKVLLPERPNGSTGWVRAADVDIEHVDHEIRIDLTARTLRWTEGANVVLETPIAVGSKQYPTPAGRFFVTDLLDTGENGGSYGPYAVGLSAHSDVLTEFGGGDGQVGIHGTNDPSSIGRPVSHGCVRVANDVITKLAATIPIGTQVTIAG